MSHPVHVECGEQLKASPILIFLFLFFGFQAVQAQIPTIPASNLTVSNLDGDRFYISFIRGDGARRLVIASQDPLTAVPQDGTDYNAGNFGLGNEIAPGQFVVANGTSNGFWIQGLNHSTTYHFRVYEYNGENFETQYLTADFLQGSASTLTAPVEQASEISFTNVRGSEMTINWQNGSGTGRMLIARADAPVDVEPQDLTNYSWSSAFGGYEIGNGNYILHYGSGSSRAITGLDPNITYHFALFEFNGNYTDSRVFHRPGARASQLTPSKPTVPASNIQTSNLDGDRFYYYMSAGNGERRVVMAKEGSAVTAVPADGISYTHHTTFGQGTEISPGEFVVYDGTSSQSWLYGLDPAKTYHLAVYEYNGTGTGTFYLTTSLLRASATTLGPPITQASNIQFTNVAGSGMTVNWQNGTGAGRMLIARAGAPVDVEPQDLTNYSWSSAFGSREIGNGNYILHYGSGSSRTISDLDPNVTYHFALFEYSGSNARQFLRPGVRASQLTPSKPTVPASNLQTSNLDGDRFYYYMSTGNGERRVVIAKEGSAVTAVPADGTSYTHHTTFGQGTEISPGEFVVYDGASNQSWLYGLDPAKTYHLAVYEYNGTGTDTFYLTTSLLRASATTLGPPLTQSSNIQFTNVTGSGMTVSWQNGTGTGRMLIARAGAPVDVEPQDLTNYSWSSAFGSREIGDGNYILHYGSGSNRTISNLDPNVTYHFALFEYSGNTARQFLRPGVLASQLTPSKPTVPASGLQTSNVEGNRFYYYMSAGNGERRVVIAKEGSAVTAVPADGTSYTHDDTFGEGTEISPGEFVIYDGTNNQSWLYGLDPAKTYHLAVYEYNGTGTNTYYLTAPFLQSNATTLSPPTVQSSSAFLSGRSNTSMNISWTRGNGSHRILIGRKDGPVNVEPQDGTDYQASTTFGNREIGTSGNFVLYGGTGNNVNVTNLEPGTNYYFALFEYNGSNPRMYMTPGYAFALETLGERPTVQVSNATYSKIDLHAFDVSFTPGNGSRRLVLAREGSAVSGGPADFTDYAANNTLGQGDEIGSDNYVVYNGTGSEFTLSGLEPGKIYHLAFFEYTVSDLGELYMSPAYSSAQSSKVKPEPDPTFPDLVIKTLSAPSSVVAGEQFTIEYSIENRGVAPTNTGWDDVFFISSSPTLTAEANLIGQQTSTAVLDPGESLDFSLSVTVPTNFLGNYYLIAQTDYQNQMDEGTSGGEDNNEANLELLINAANSGAVVTPGDPGNFITTWKTDNPGTSADDQIIIFTNGNGSNYHVYWEDVNDASVNGIEAGLSGNATITFPHSGTYRIEISGGFDRIYCGNMNSDAEKLIALNQWGNIHWTSMNRAFSTASEMEYQATDMPDLSGVTDLEFMFFGAIKFNGDLSNWNVSNVTEMTAMLSNTGLSTANYDATLIGWADQENVPFGITLGAQNLTFCAGAEARQTLIDQYGWTITGDSPACSSMLIFVETEDGNTLIVLVEASDTIQQTKQKIQDKSGIALSLQQLFYEGIELEEGRILQDYGIENGNTLHLIVNTGPIISPNNNTLYVDINVNTSTVDYTGSGDSWTNAIPQLADALQWAQANKDEGLWDAANPLKIFVATGEYKPSVHPSNNESVNGRHATFLMVKDVRIYGGFPKNGEPTMADRDWQHHTTTLQGEVPNGNRAYHVVLSAGEVGSALLDGFIIMGGNADRNLTGNITVNGEVISPACGGGMYNNNSSPTLTNVILSGNTATRGGGMYNDYNSSPSLTNVSILGNTATDSDSGGGILNDSFASPTLQNSIVWGNGAGDPIDGEPLDASSSHNLIEGGHASNIAGYHPEIDITDIFTDPLHPAKPDYILKAGSPGINTGSNAAYTSAGGDLANELDLSGNPRLIGGTIDLGAYESPYENMTSLTDPPEITVDYGTVLTDVPLPADFTVEVTLSDGNTATLELDRNTDNWVLTLPADGSYDPLIAGTYAFEVPILLRSETDPDWFSNSDNLKATLSITVSKGTPKLSATWDGTDIVPADGLDLTYGDIGALTVSHDNADTEIGVAFSSGDLVLDLTDLSAVAAHQVGTGVLTVTLPETDNFEHARFVFEVQVDKGQLTITADPQTKVYGEGDPAFTHTTTGYMLGDDQSIITGTLERASGENVGTYAINQGSLDAGANYVIAYNTDDFTITPATRTLTFPALKTKTYGDPDFALNASSSSDEAITYTSNNEQVARVISGHIQILGAGTAIITATVPENTNYQSRPSVSQTLIVAKAEQNLTLQAPDQVFRDAGNVGLIVSSSSELPVTISVDDELVASVNGLSLIIHRLGTVQVTATQAGDSNYEAAVPVTVTVEVVRRADDPGPGPDTDLNLRAHPAISPNGDGINDFLIIEGILNYPDNRVKIFNRNGMVLYEASGYNNGSVRFEGQSKSGQSLPAGTYYYIVEVDDRGSWKQHKSYFVLRY